MMLATFFSLVCRARKGRPCGHGRLIGSVLALAEERRGEIGLIIGARSYGAARWSPARRAKHTILPCRDNLIRVWVRELTCGLIRWDYGLARWIGIIVGESAD